VCAIADLPQLCKPICLFLLGLGQKSQGVLFGEKPLIPSSSPPSFFTKANAD
jgi:hypothetical protein